MLSVKSIGKRLLESNRLLTIYSFFSVLIGTVLIVEMFNLSLSASHTYEQDMKAMYGDCDMGVYYSDYANIETDVVKAIGQMEDITQMATICYSGRVVIGESNVYTIGTDNSSMVRSRYHFDCEPGDGQAVVNKVLAEARGYAVGDRVKIGDQSLEIIEIFEDGNLSEAAVEMLVVNKKILKLMDEGAGDVNIIMLKVAEGRETQVQSEIINLNKGVEVILFGTDEAYLKAVRSFRLYIIILAVMVILATCLFTATVFKGFVCKYRRDMAVLRMMRATQEQINHIFNGMIRSVTLAGVIVGFGMAWCVNQLLVKGLNEKYGFVEGDVVFRLAESLMICIGIYLVLRIVLQVIISRSNRVLPIEALVYNELSSSGKMKQKKPGIRKWLKRDLFVSTKLIGARLKENTYVIATMALLVAISILGASLSSIIKANGERYYRDSYLTETILSCSAEWDYQEGSRFYESLKADDALRVSCVYSAGYPAQSEEISVRYCLADINGMVEQGLLETEGVGATGIIISQSLQEQLSLEKGDAVRIWSPAIPAYDINGIPTGEFVQDEKEHTMQVSAVMPDAFFYDSDIYVDISQANFINDGVWFEKIYIDGEKEYIEQKLNVARNDFPGIKWSNYTDAVTENNHAVESRFRLINLVVKVLVLIAAIGWINSLRNMFVSATRDYDIIRMQGVSGKRILKILVYQVLIYMLIGLVTGAAAAVLILEILMYMEQRAFIWQFNLEILMEMLATMLALCLTLIPTVRRLCTKKILEEN